MKPAANRPVSFEQAALLCPTQGQAERVAEKFGLAVPDYQAIRELHARALHDMADGLTGALNDKATQMHFQRIVGLSLQPSAPAASTPRRFPKPAPPHPAPPTAAKSPAPP
ncbi:MAG TPA: hypothetical protein VKG78_10715 [Opitutaceae bacterium]|nr:hypothetical protein [Opitutaceae bacterium]